MLSSCASDGQDNTLPLHRAKVASVFQFQFEMQVAACCALMNSRNL